MGSGSTRQAQGRDTTDMLKVELYDLKGQVVITTQNGKTFIGNQNTHLTTVVVKITVPNFEVGYDDPCPPEYSIETLQGEVKWFDDAIFRNAMTNSETFQYQITSDGAKQGNNTKQKRPDSVNGKRSKQQQYKGPYLSFHTIDHHAKETDANILDTVEDLIQYLTEPLENDLFRKIKTARAIIVWMSHQLQKEEKGKKVKADVATPRGLIQCIKYRKMTETACYTSLCRKAGIQCAIIKGYVKDTDAMPDDSYTPLIKYCAVNVEHGWQIVIPAWVLRGVVGYQSGGWTKVEADGKAMNEKQVASAGKEIYTFSEQYFMPNLQEIIYMVCATDVQWQLVPSDLQVQSRKEFVLLPVIYGPFIALELQLVSEQRYFLYSKDGFCTIKLKGNPSKTHMIVLKYELFKQDTQVESSAEAEDDTNLARMVFNTKEMETFIFQIRFHQTGVYKLIIHGGPYRSTRFSARFTLCEFILICEEAMKGRTLLPLACGNVGWGPGLIAEEAGLYIPSKPSGIISVCDENRTADVKFQLRNMKERYSASVHGEVGGRRKQLDSSCVDIRKNEQLHQLQISVSLPEKGEYGLAIQHLNGEHSDGQVDARQGENVCNYLLSTLSYKPDRANVRLARKALNDAMSTNVEPRQWKDQIIDIQRCIARCKKEGIPESDGDIQAADAMVWFLICKDKLRDCFLRRNLYVIRKTLELVSLYKNQGALMREIEAVKKLETAVCILQELKHSDLVTAYPQYAPAEVQNTLAALVALLGNEEQMIQTWSGIKVALYHPLFSVVIQMENLFDKKISESRIKRALDILHTFDKDQVRQVSKDAYTFYVWIELVADMQAPTGL